MTQSYWYSICFCTEILPLCYPRNNGRHTQRCLMQLECLPHLFCPTHAQTYFPLLHELFQCTTWFLFLSMGFEFSISDCNSSELIQLSLWFQSLLSLLERDLNLDSFHFSQEKAHEVCSLTGAIVDKKFFQKQVETVRMIISLWVFLLPYCFQGPCKRSKVAAFLFT